MTNPELNTLLRRHNELTSKSHSLMHQLIKAIEAHTKTTDKTINRQLDNVVYAINEVKYSISTK